MGKVLLIMVHAGANEVRSRNKSRNSQVKKKKKKVEMVNSHYLATCILL